MIPKILITGHCGYVGTALGRALNRVGLQFLGADIRADPAIDISTQKGQDLIVAAKPDLIFNLAAISGETACLKNVKKAISVNCWAPRELFFGCADSVFVQASSASVLGNRGPRVTPYASTKARSEISGMLILRLGTVVGWNPECMRWDTPAHKMMKDGLRSPPKITVNGPKRMRPWVTLDFLVAYLCSLAVNFSSSTLDESNTYCAS